MNAPTTPKILRREEVEAITGLARSTLYRLVKEKKLKPPIALTDSGKAVGWLESDIAEYLHDRIAAAKANAAQ